MELTGPLANLTSTLTRLLVQAGSAVLMVVLAWQCLKLLLSGGSERLGREIAVRVLILGMAVAALTNLSATAGLVQAVGAALWGGVVDAVRAGL